MESIFHIFFKYVEMQMCDAKLLHFFINGFFYFCKTFLCKFYGEEQLLVQEHVDKTGHGNKYCISTEEYAHVEEELPQLFPADVLLFHDEIYVHHMYSRLEHNKVIQHHNGEEIEESRLNKSKMVCQH